MAITLAEVRGEAKARYSVLLKQPKSLFLVMLFLLVSLA